jgi:Ca2+-binding RTX toxin-like protein
VDDIRGNDINGSGGTAAPQMFTADGDSDPELFFARPDGVWGSGYAAEYQGDFLPGISEPLVLLQGRNKITDCFNGSGDENILLLTDDDNGDAVFADDLYSARPSEADEMQSRLSYIREIRAGAGNDVIDLTSSSLCCDGWEMTIHGGDGDDVIWASGGDNDLFGDAGNDRIIGSSGFDVIAGGTGNDCMQSGGGDDIFCFGSNWGNDTVVLNSPAVVCTLWFASGSANNWDAAARIYRSGSNSVTVLGEGNVQLYFGNDSHAQPNQYADLQASGAFSENSSEKIFEDKSKGLLA